MFQEYKNYIQNNPNGYWFKRKLYGWGWTPVRWQGWLVVGAYIVSLLFLSFMQNEKEVPQDFLGTFFIPILFLTGLLLGICYWKGEKPRWQWGKEKE